MFRFSEPVRVIFFTEATSVAVLTICFLSSFIIQRVLSIEMFLLSYYERSKGLLFGMW